MNRPGSVLHAETSRRAFLRLGVASAGLVGAGMLGFAGCALAARPQASQTGPGYDYIMPTDPEVARAEPARAASGRIAAFSLAAAPAVVDLAGTQVMTWAYGGKAVAPELRVGRGDRMQVAVTNGLPADTTLHWHGIRIRNDMDGAAPTTQRPIAANGGEHAYDFVVPDPGTHWYHSHSGLQADRGLFGALIVEDPDDATGADADAVLVLDDWLDGLGTTPDAVLLALNPALAGAHGHHGDGTTPPPTGVSATASDEEYATAHADSVRCITFPCNGRAFRRPAARPARRSTGPSRPAILHASACRCGPSAPGHERSGRRHRRHAAWRGSRVSSLPAG